MGVLGRSAWGSLERGKTGLGGVPEGLWGISGVELGGIPWGVPGVFWGSLGAVLGWVSCRPC